ncbi:MAG: DUF1592 domain-containing protein [Bryobacteraceae bacterium]|nr:DUF1592 domain-containing protein [Bryobacteraceae bacterium]
MKIDRSTVFVVAALLPVVLAGAEPAAHTTTDPTATFRQYCYGCHGKAAKIAGIDLEALTGAKSVGSHFGEWEKVASVLEQKRMPPVKMKQPAEADRAAAATWIRARLDEYAQKHAGDPGQVTVRRLTSGEYSYTVEDLTGMDLKLDDSSNDSVGGEGFTNFGDVQFMADASLERYLETAKKVADRAVIGAGPLQFFDAAGKSGFELSAIHRIQEIYKNNGFRANSGEGGKPYGTERYSKAFFVCWQFQNRVALGKRQATLATLAAREGVSPRFAQHLLSVVQDRNATYPTSEVVKKFQSLPVVKPASNKEAIMAEARAGSEQVTRSLIDWPRWLLAMGAFAEGGAGDERALVLNEEALKASTTHHFKFNVRTPRDKSSKAYLMVVPVNAKAKDRPFVVWQNAKIRIRGKDRELGPVQPLKAVLTPDSISKLNFGSRPDGKPLGEDAVATVGDGTTVLEFAFPDTAFGAELQVDAEIAGSATGDAVLRCTLSGSPEQGMGVPTYTLLGTPSNPGYKTWKENVLAFAAKLPQNSQGEPTPADKDPIPPPFNNVYNQPERDHFHLKLKYYRTDDFLYSKVLDDAQKAKLDQAWNDLLASFEYHDVFLRFVSDKYKLGIKKGVADLTATEIAALPAEPQQYVRAIRSEYDSVQKAQLTGRQRHLEDAVTFASAAWRRPLNAEEKDRLRGFYVKATEQLQLDHVKAMRLLLARVLVAPAFLYRLEEQPTSTDATIRELSSWELASRLSYFLWSSIPDQELRRAATAGELGKPELLQAQVKRMLADPKARRLSTEFFGQWLGFYRFDQYKGVDTTRFTEFTDEVKTSMYDEAVAFFEHVVRKDRPVREIFFADYTFLNQPLAKHYGIEKEFKSKSDLELIEGAGAMHRGGMFRLGAVLTSTSAPLRTSPVKRGDWMLRRVLGTPTPPPPADAGSLPADDKNFGGMSVKQRLESHKRNPTCAGCHTRIDPLGFPLERYDSVGRWRNTYADGKSVDDSSRNADNLEISGVDGLLEYLKTQQPQVLKTFNSKLLGYALGRTVLGSDRPLIDKMVQAGGDVNFSALVTEIALSKQFRYRKEGDEGVPGSPMQTAGRIAVIDREKEGER